MYIKISLTQTKSTEKTESNKWKKVANKKGGNWELKTWEMTAGKSDGEKNQRI